MGRDVRDGGEERVLQHEHALHSQEVLRSAVSRNARLNLKAHAMICAEVIDLLVEGRGPDLSHSRSSAWDESRSLAGAMSSHIFADELDNVERFCEAWSSESEPARPEQGRSSISSTAPTSSQKRRS